jgi:hypothetical protein
MKIMKLTKMRKIQAILFLTTMFFMSVSNLQAQVPDDEQGLRAAWMKGSWGALWLPEKCYNGNIEGVTIDEFVTQIEGINTIDYVQIALTNPNIYSPVHTAPNDIIESLWHGDTDSTGNTINLVVPRSTVEDPFLSWLVALKAAGLKVEVYVNSYNLLARDTSSIPDDYPDVSDRWMEYCDTNSTVQTFINSQTYHSNDSVRRPYMFCYAEFILKEYAIRYGDLIDAWCFDSADNIMEDECGDDPASDDIEDQRIYQAFANAVHAGNPNAAVAFNNSVGDRVENPFSTATYFDDYTFGHPFGGAGDMVENETLYTYNYHVIEWMRDYAGSAFLDDDRDWNDNVVSHFFPKQSTTSWNSGSTACLTDDEFVEWTSTGIIDGGAITWGTPLVIVNLENSGYNLTLQDYALDQLELTDNYLKEYQNADQPNWSRQATILPDAYIGQTYYCELAKDFDFWDVDEDAAVILINNDSLPSWMTLNESVSTPGNYILSGIPTEIDSTDYTFSIGLKDTDDEVFREVDLLVLPNNSDFTNPGDGSPVWYADTLIYESIDISETFSQIFVYGKDFYDFDEEDVLTITKKGESGWLSIVEETSGVWKLYGTPSTSEDGVYIDTLCLSDGTFSVNRIFTIEVNQPTFDLTDDYIFVEIKAAADSIYGVDSVATMVSDTITAPDGLATFQISIDVTPGAGKSISSGTSGGLSTSQAWGLGEDERLTAQNNIFYGSLEDWVGIGDIQIVNFNSNGGEIYESDFEELVIDSIIVVNAQSGGKDAVAYVISGDTTDLGNVSSTPCTVDISNVKSLSLGVGNSADPTKNKWSVEGIGVAYSLGTYYTISTTSENGTIGQSLANQTAYKAGTEIELVAVPNAGYVFDSWSGDISDATIDANTLSVVLNDNKSITAVFSVSTSIAEMESSFSYSIFPNPSDGIFHVNLSQELSGTYSVYSISGSTILQGEITRSFDFDLSNFKKGFYLFEIKTEQGVNVKKIVLN